MAQKKVAKKKAAPKKAARKKATPKKASPKKPTANVYQFKITLLGAKPAIWRRIQVQDCTLDKLHEHIQTAMGWTNSHLHQFDIQGTPYGDPGLLEDGFDDIEYVDSTRTLLSTILPNTGQRFAFDYEYDFGDGWGHEVLFEGSPSRRSESPIPCMPGRRTGLSTRRLRWGLGLCGLPRSHPQSEARGTRGPAGVDRRAVRPGGVRCSHGHQKHEAGAAGLRH